MQRGQKIIVNKAPQPKCDFFIAAPGKSRARPPNCVHRGPLSSGWPMGLLTHCLTPLASRLLRLPRAALKTALGCELSLTSNVHKHAREAILTVKSCCACTCLGWHAAPSAVGALDTSQSFRVFKICRRGRNNMYATLLLPLAISKYGSNNMNIKLLTSLKITLNK